MARPLGLLLKDRYQLLSLLYSNEHKRIHLALDCKYENRLVAIKEVKHTILDDWSSEDIPELVAAIEREPILLSELSHPHIPQYYEHFEDDDAWYLVMEFIDGCELRSWLPKVLPSEDVWNAANEERTRKLLAVGIQLCDVVEYLHTREPIILHRDIKPNNIMITPQGKVMLIDFGIACCLARGETGRACWGLTPGYAAPEQELDEQTTPFPKCIAWE